jgi:hypothetical protein
MDTIARLLGEGKKIVSMVDGDLCYQTLPCVHGCAVTFDDGSVVRLRLRTPENIEMRKRHGLPPDPALDRCMLECERVLNGYTRGGRKRGCSVS